MEAARRIEDLSSFLAMEAKRDSRTFMEEVVSDDKGDLIILGDIHSKLHEFIHNNKYGVIELPRESGKTTNIIGLIPWLIGNNKNIRTKIVSSADTIATARGKAIREILESDRYRRVFPSVLRGREWTDSRFSVLRETITPESTVECYGVNSRATGGRCDWLFLDDVDDEEVVVSETKRRRNYERVLNVWMNLLPPDGKAFAFATPWHEADTIHKLKAEGWPVYRKPVVNMRPVWPERWGEKELRSRKRKIGSLAFARGYELIPISSETAPIKGEWFKYWEKLPRLSNIAIAVDPNNSLSERADYTAIGVFGVTPDFKVYLLEMDRDHYEFPGLVARIKEMAERAAERYKRIPMIGVEETAFQKAIPQTLKRESRFPIVGIRADRSKFIRASRLAVHIENGRVFLKGDGRGSPHKEARQVYDECVSYPASATVDCVDMLGYGVELMLRYARKSGAVTG